jgi:nitrite reductase/ring-hydroxylating ferredoxin subunit
MSDEFIPVVRTPELGPGEVREVEAHGRHVGVTNIGQTYYAFEAACPVDGTNLAREGLLKGDLIVCPQDDAAFDVRTGEAMEPGAPGLQRYPIRVEGNEVKVGPALSRQDSGD